MKKLLLLLAVTLVVTLNASAQTEVGVGLGTFTYDFQPNRFSQSFEPQFSKEVYLKEKSTYNGLRAAVRFSNGTVNHTSNHLQNSYYYDFNDTVDFKGSWDNTKLSIGYERYFSIYKFFKFYGGADFVFIQYHFNGEPHGYYNGYGTEPFLGCSFTVKKHISINIESSCMVYNMQWGSVIEPSPLNKIQVGYSF